MANSAVAAIKGYFGFGNKSKVENLEGYISNDR